MSEYKLMQMLALVSLNYRRAVMAGLKYRATDRG